MINRGLSNYSYHSTIPTTKKQYSRTKLSTFYFQSRSFLENIFIVKVFLFIRVPQIQTHHDTCRNPLKGAKPVPGPTMIIGIEGSAGNLKLDGLIKIGAQLQSLRLSKGTAFWSYFLWRFIILDNKTREQKISSIYHQLWHLSMNIPKTQKFGRELRPILSLKFATNLVENF